MPLFMAKFHGLRPRWTITRTIFETKKPTQMSLRAFHSTWSLPDGAGSDFHTVHSAVQHNGWQTVNNTQRTLTTTTVVFSCSILNHRQPTEAPSRHNRRNPPSSSRDCSSLGSALSQLLYLPSPPTTQCVYIVVWESRSPTTQSVHLFHVSRRIIRCVPDRV